MFDIYDRERNPQYEMFYTTWVKMWDAFQGEEHMKNRALEQNTSNLNSRTQIAAITTFDQYLRPTDSMRRLGDLGYQRFCDYIYLAKYYPFPVEVRSQSLGLIENQHATIELPVKMSGMIEDATANNDSMEKVLSLINERQLQSSRLGLLLVPSTSPSKPFNIAFYSSTSILDWVEVLDGESDKVFDWVKLATGDVDINNKPIFLILMRDERGVYVQYKTINSKARYGESFELDGDYIADTYVEPMAGEKPLTEIPFVVVNATSLGGDVERPFMEQVVDASISLFRASAHYENALHWGGESTLFTKGYGLGAKDADKRIYVGNGATNLSSLEYADAKYVTMGTDGIEPRKQNVRDQYEYCISLGVDLINQGTESGTALNIRTNIKTASLKTLSLTGALGLESILRIGAVWIGADPGTVSVIANTSFSDHAYTAEDFVKLSSMIGLGTLRPIDMYTLQSKNSITDAESFEEWQIGLEKPVTEGNDRNEGDDSALGKTNLIS